VALDSPALEDTATRRAGNLLRTELRRGVSPTVREGSVFGRLSPGSQTEFDAGIHEAI